MIREHLFHKHAPADPCSPCHQVWPGARPPTFVHGLVGWRTAVHAEKIQERMSASASA